jgi:hypothetical protein
MTPPNNVHYLRGKKLAQSESDLRSTLVYWLEEFEAGHLKGIAAALLWELNGQQHETTIAIHGAAKNNPGVCLIAAKRLQHELQKILRRVWDQREKKAKRSKVKPTYGEEQSQSTLPL